MSSAERDALVDLAESLPRCNHREDGHPCGALPISQWGSGQTIRYACQRHTETHFARIPYAPAVTHAYAVLAAPPPDERVPEAEGLMARAVEAWVEATDDTLLPPRMHQLDAVLCDIQEYLTRASAERRGPG